MDFFYVQGKRDKTGYSCDTVGCIAGWLVHLEPNRSISDLTGTGARRLLKDEFENGAVTDLFHPEIPITLWDTYVHGYEPIEVRHAIEAIDNMLEHGEPRWEKVLENVHV